MQHVQNVWGDPLTAAGVQSRDGKAAYVELNLAGNQGSTLGNESVKAVREIVDKSAPPKGLKVYVTGPAPLTTDMNEAADKSMFKMMGVTGVVIMIMLFIAYRSVSTVLLVLVMVGFEMGTARGLVALLGNYDLLGFSTFVVAMLSSLAIAAGTDYAIFLIGRYQEARQAGQDRETAYYTMFRGTSHIILGSGLTIAGATFCLHLARLSYFKALGIPSALGLLVVVAGALTAAPAVVAVATRFGLLDPRRMIKTRGWRRIGTATVRWPGAVFAASLVIAIVGILIMPSMKISYNDRYYIPGNLPSNVGYAAAERHFSAATMNPDILMIESDHDMRNSGDMIILDRLAKDVFRSPGIAMVQSITRPLGGPIEHTSIPFQISAQSIPIQQNLQFMKDRTADMLKMSDDLGAMIGSMQRMQGLLGQMSSTTHHMVGDMGDMQVHAGRDARPSGGLRRFRETVPQLLVLGTTLFQHPRLLGVEVGVRGDRRCGQVQREHEHADQGHEQCRRDNSPDAGPVPADHRRREVHAGDAAHDAQQLLGSGHANGPDDRYGERDGSGLRRLQEWRLLLLAAGSVPESRLPARPETLPVAGRQGRALHHHPRRGPGNSGRHFRGQARTGRRTSKR